MILSASTNLKVVTQVGVATTGGMSAVVFGNRTLTLSETIAVLVIVAVALMFGSLAREETMGAKRDAKFERRRSIALFGALYFLSLYIADKVAGNVLTSAMVGVAVGASGPAALVPLIKFIVALISRMFPKGEEDV